MRLWEAGRSAVHASEVVGAYLGIEMLDERRS